MALDSLSGEVIYNAAQQLDADTQVITIDLGLSEQDIKLLDTFNIDQDQEYRNFNELPVLLQEVTDFLSSLSTSNEREAIDYLSMLIRNIANEVVLSIKNPEYEVQTLLRASKPQQEYKIEWHTDDEESTECRTQDFPPTPKKFSYNFLTTLKGPTTLYYIRSAEIRMKLQDDCVELGMNCDNNNLMASFLNFAAASNKLGYNTTFQANIFSPQQGTAAVHLIDSEIGAIHTAPTQSNQGRLFLSFFIQPSIILQEFKATLLEVTKRANEKGQLLFDLDEAQQGLV